MAACFQQKKYRLFLLPGFCLAFFLLLIFAETASAQKPTKIELIRAETLEFDKHLKKDVRRLINNVKLKHDDAYMHCDSAYLYTDENRFDAFSNIYIIVSDSVFIWGDELQYSGDTKIAELHGNVRMVDGETTLTSEHLFYDMQRNVAYYFTGGHIVSSENKLNSLIGKYFTESKMFFFKDSVHLVNPDYTIYADTLKYNTQTEVAYFFGPTTIISDNNIIYCENGWYDTKNDLARFSKNAYLKNEDQKLKGDSLFYDRNKGYGKALKNVSIQDFKENLVIHGQFGEYYELTENSLVTDSAYLVKFFEKDSLFLNADTLKSLLDTCGEKRKLLGYYKVKFFKPDLQGLCDSIIFFFSDSTINMHGSPVIWNEDNQISAAFIQIFLLNNTIDRMHMKEHAFIASQEDTSGFNQIKGDVMHAFFEDDNLHKIDVFENGHTVYFVKEEDDTKTGVNISKASTMTIFLSNNQVNRIIFRAKPNATLYPIDEVPEDEMLLEGFKWLHFLRPTDQKDIFNWRTFPNDN